MDIVRKVQDPIMHIEKHYEHFCSSPYSEQHGMRHWPPLVHICSVNNTIQRNRRGESYFDWYSSE